MSAEPTVTDDDAEPVTDAEVDAAIVAALQRTGDKLVCWTPIRDRIQGGFWQKGRAYMRLFEFGVIYATKIYGVPYISLAHECDRRSVMEARAQGRVREMRIMD